MVLFGGRGFLAGDFLGDTWEWDGAAWKQTATTGPPPRIDACMAYDSARRRVVLFGGNDVNYGLFSDTWEFDGKAWTKVATTGPSPRTAAAMVYHSVRGRILLFGGAGAGGRLADTWEWDGKVWAQVVAAGPPVRSGCALAFDPDRRKVILFGGWDAEGYYLGDMWEWDGERMAWTNVSGAGPSERGEPMMAYDIARRRAVLFGGWCNGALGDTWEYGIITNAYNLAEVARALSMAAGLSPAGSSDLSRLDVYRENGSGGRLDLRDACRLARKATGLEPNP
jgi:hypothetical protein